MKLQGTAALLLATALSAAVSPAALRLTPERRCSVCRDIICYTIDTLPAGFQHRQEAETFTA